MRLEWGPHEGRMTWDAAVKLAASKGNGWRLPTVPELVSQYDYDVAKPKDADWEGWYWSSSPNGVNLAWLVDFGSGYMDTNGRDSEYGVRCVREVGGISTDQLIDESRNQYAVVFQKCAGGCGKEPCFRSNELVLWNLHGPFKWWCQPCAERVEAEKLWTPMVEALEKSPTLRAKLREILEVK